MTEFGEVRSYWQYNELNFSCFIVHGWGMHVGIGNKNSKHKELVNLKINAWNKNWSEVKCKLLLPRARRKSRELHSSDPSDCLRTTGDCTHRTHLARPSPNTWPLSLYEQSAPTQNSVRVFHCIVVLSSSRTVYAESHIQCRCRNYNTDTTN